MRIKQIGSRQQSADPNPDAESNFIKMLKTSQCMINVVQSHIKQVPTLQQKHVKQLVAFDEELGNCSSYNDLNLISK